MRNIFYCWSIRNQMLGVVYRSNKIYKMTNLKNLFIRGLVITITVILLSVIALLLCGKSVS